MTDYSINEKVAQLKTQVATLEQLLNNNEQAVFEHAGKLEQALSLLQQVQVALPAPAGELGPAPAKTTRSAPGPQPSGTREPLAKINECFLRFGSDATENINLLTALCGELLGATCALYNRLDQGLLCSLGQWQTPPDYNPVDQPDGHICYDVIKAGSDELFLVRDLPQTVYAQSDPNVIPYQLQTYLGKAVRCGRDYVGSLCVVYQSDFIPDEEAEELLGIIASAIGVEEERKQAGAELEQYRDQLKDLVEARTVELEKEVAERRQAEEAVRESEKRFRSAFEDTLIGMAMVSPQGSFLRVNQALSRMLGYTEQELLALNFQKLTHPDDLETSVGYLRQVMAGEIDAFQDEKRYLHKQGYVIWVQISVSAIRDAQDQPLYFITQVQNITARKHIEATLAKRAAELETVAQVSTAASTILDTGRLLQQVADLTKERFNLYHAHIYLLDEQADTLNLTAGAGEVGRQMVAEGWSIPLERKQSLVARAARNGQGVIVNDVQAEPGFMPNPLLPDTRSEMAVPMLVGDRVVGVLDVQADVVDRFTEEDVQITTTLAAQVAVALENANLLQQTQAALSQTEEQAQRLGQLGQMSAQLNLATTEADIFKVASERTPNIVPSDRASVALLVETGDSLEVLALQGQAGAVPVGASLPIEGTGLGRAVQEKQLVNTPDTQGSDLIDINMMAQQGIRSTLSVPLVIGGQAIGTLNVGSTRAQAYDLRDENMMRQVGALLSSALENRRLLQQTEMALAEMQQSQKMLRSVIDATPDWIFIKDQEHRYRLVNQGYANDLHLTPDDFIGKNDLELGFPEELVKGNPEKGIRGFWADDQLVIDSGETQVYPSDPATIDDELHVFHTIKTPLRDAEGNIWGVLAFARDITEREKLLVEMQQSQELLRSVIDATPDWILVKDREHRFRLVNQGFADSLHMAVEDIIGKDDIELGVPEEVVKGNPEKGIKGFWTDDLEVMGSGQAKIIEAEPTVIDGKPAFLNTIKSPMRDANGEVWGVLAFIRNITTLKQAEESQTKRAAELTCLNEIGREMESAPPVPELLQWTTERVPPAMQYPELCAVAIEYDDQIYGMPQAIQLASQMTHGLYVGSEIVGRVYIAYTEKHDFLNEESALLGGVASRLGGYIENRRLLEQVQLRARREQILREVTDRIRGSVEVETIMRTAAQEVGQVLGRPAFVYLGNGDNGEQPQTSEEEKEL